MTVCKVTFSIVGTISTCVRMTIFCLCTRRHNNVCNARKHMTTSLPRRSCGPSCNQIIADPRTRRPNKLVSGGEHQSLILGCRIFQAPSEKHWFAAPKSLPTSFTRPMDRLCTWSSTAERHRSIWIRAARLAKARKMRKIHAGLKDRRSLHQSAAAHDRHVVR